MEGRAAAAVGWMVFGRAAGRPGRGLGKLYIGSDAGAGFFGQLWARIRGPDKWVSRCFNGLVGGPETLILLKGGGVSVWDGDGGV